MQNQELSINSADVSIQPPNIADFLSPKLIQAIEQLSVREKGMADLEQSSEGPLSPSLGVHQDIPVDFVAVDAAYFEGVSAEVAAAATRTIEAWSPLLRPLERESTVSVTAKAAALPLAAGAADALAAMGEPDTAAESTEPHVIVKDSTASEDTSEWEWWW